MSQYNGRTVKSTVDFCMPHDNVLLSLQMMSNPSLAIDELSRFPAI